MRRIAKITIGIIASIVGLILFLCIAAVGAFAFFNSPPHFSFDYQSGQEGLIVEQGSGEGVIVRFDVRRGESARSVGRRLAEYGLIRNEVFWNLLFRYNKEHVKTGTYFIELPASQVAIHQILISGRQILHRVTIPEGFTLTKTARVLEEAGICTVEEFLAAANDPQIISRFRIPGQSMEGYLFPDTYLFPQEYPAAKVVEAMANNFFQRLAEIDGNAINKTPEELNRLVILASIVEREYRLPEEAPIMAGVFTNRLRIGMALQSCATVEYVITEIQGRPHPNVLTFRDIEIRNPFNTYIHPGLPPGPISSPGTVALRAAMFPAETNYFYFRLIDAATGRHHFSRTYDEHIRAARLIVRGNT